MSRLLAVLTVGVVLVAAGCASSGGSSARARNVITAEDLALSRHIYLFDYLRDHPRIQIVYNSDMGQDEMRLVGRSSPTLSGGDAGVLLVVDGTRRNNAISTARDLRLEEIALVRILYASEAGGRYGTGSSNGVIEVTLK